MVALGGWLFLVSEVPLYEGYDFSLMEMHPPQSRRSTLIVGDHIFTFVKQLVLVQILSFKRVIVL